MVGAPASSYEGWVLTSTLDPYSVVSNITPTTSRSASVPSLRWTQWISAECSDPPICKPKHEQYNGTHIMRKVRQAGDKIGTWKVSAYCIGKVSKVCWYHTLLTYPRITRESACQSRAQYEALAGGQRDSSSFTDIVETTIKQQQTKQKTFSTFYPSELQKYKTKTNGKDIPASSAA